MQKRFLTAIIPVLLLTGCQNSSTSPEQVQQMALMQEKRIGVLQSLGGALTSSQATNLLRMDDGKTIYLKSSVLDLNAEKFNGKEVEVMGEIARTTDGNQTMSVKSIDIIDSEVSTNQDIPEWVAYSSENLGISLKYRNDYLLNEAGNEIDIQAKPAPESATAAVPASTSTSSSSTVAKTVAMIKMQLVSKDPNFDLAKEMNVLSLSNADVLAGGFNRSKITQKAVDAYKYSDAGGKSIVYYLKNGSGTYKISFAADNNPDALITEQNMFYDILASVDFVGMAAPETTTPTPTIEPKNNLDSDTTTSNGTINGFETFKSTSLKFSMQYPKSYYFSDTAASAGATKSYQFGSQPLDTHPAEITLDLVKSLPTGGKTTDYNGINMVKVTSGSNISVYLSKNGKVFKLTGPSVKEGLLEQMLSTVQS